jgi:hypothetical protein
LLAVQHPVQLIPDIGLLLRKQIMPEPRLSSSGNNSQGIPERSTNRMLLNTLRLHSGKRPLLRLRCFFLRGKG